MVLLSYLVSVDFGSRTSPEVQKSYDYLESLPEGSVVMVSFDHEASSLPEIQPISMALLRHAFRNGLKLVGVSLFAEGTAIGYRLMNKTAGEFGKRYGTDYVFMGFKPQQTAAILGMGESIKNIFPEDYMGTPTERLPLMADIEDYDDIDMVISIADGSLTIQWIEYAGAKYNQKVMAGLTAAMITSYDPYLSSGQLYSVVGGLKGAAEYESMIDRKGGGTRGMMAQTLAHLYVIVLIIIGNIFYFRNKSKGEAKP